MFIVVLFFFTFLICQSFLSMFLSPYYVRLEDNPGMGQHMDGTTSFTFALLLFISSLCETAC